MNYYNEFDPNAAAWLRQLIAEGLIPNGVVDERSITEINALDLEPFTQCHFFAGIGGWSLALRLAGVSPDTRLWTGSCPCQPFSAAGKGLGTADERHLWPVWFKLIEACRPPLVFGEQVASAAVIGGAAKKGVRESGGTTPPVWLDGVFADLEGSSYACAAADIPAAGVGAPHIRQRLFWMAYAKGEREHGRPRIFEKQIAEERNQLGSGSTTHRAANTECTRRKETGMRSEIDTGREPEQRRPLGGVEHTDGRNSGSEREQRGGEQRLQPDGSGCDERMGDTAGHDQLGERQCGKIDRWTLPVGGSGPWGDHRIILCRDGKHRRIPAEPALFPLADGLPYKLARRGSIRPALLKGPGNAIVPEAAAVFIRATINSVK